MLIDYLRYLAFRGRLRPFFEGGLYDYVEPSATTGQHLRFAPDYLVEKLGSQWRALLLDLYCEPHSKELAFERLRRAIGLAGALTEPDLQVGGTPSTFAYRELEPPRVEIIVDVSPGLWEARYSEGQSYEGVPVIYRRANWATGTFRSGAQLFDSDRYRLGTLCGIFRSAERPNQPAFALTCGHVTGKGSHVVTQQRRRLWKLPLWSSFTSLGETRYVAKPGRSRGSLTRLRVHDEEVQTQLDAALIELKHPRMGAAEPEPSRVATIKPITTLLQEEPVRFRGAGRAVDTLARILAVTVRKSIDLSRDGDLCDVGDVLMLGHRHPMYIAQRVSRPGDSGAAVRQDYSSVGPLAQLNQWHGMVLGGDEGGAYATYAEHLWAWAAQVTGDLSIEFYFDE